MTLARFDGGFGRYSLLMGKARGVEGPETFGTYVWAEVNDWPTWERTLIEGPCAHHIVGIHDDVVPVLQEAVKYLQPLSASQLP